MTREEFIEVLDEKGYSYEIEGDKIVVTKGDEIRRVMLRSLKTLPLGVEFKNGGDVDLRSLETIPPGVEFKNGGAVDLRSLESIPPGVEFKNKGPVYLESLKTLPPGVEFKNKGPVWLESLKTLPPGVEFKNKGTVWLKSLVGGKFSDWIGNIEGINSKRLLNVMISKGVFER